MPFRKNKLLTTPDPRELFDSGLELFSRGAVDEAVAVLREAFFGNVFIAPILTGKQLELKNIWIPGPSGSSESAKEYVHKQRQKWQNTPSALRFLRCLWNDPLVRRETQSYLNVCKSYSRTEGLSRVTRELMNENAHFTNKRRIRSTQKEILDRIHSFQFDLPPSIPSIATVTILNSRAADIAAFIERVLGFRPLHRENSPIWLFSLHETGLRIIDGDREQSGIEITLQVSDLSYYLFRLEDEEIIPRDMQTKTLRGRYILIEAPGTVYIRLVEHQDPSHESSRQ